MFTHSNLTFFLLTPLTIKDLLIHMSIISSKTYITPVKGVIPGGTGCAGEFVTQGMCHVHCQTVLTDPELRLCGQIWF